MKSAFGWTIAVMVFLAYLGVVIVGGIRAKVRYTNEVYTHWEMADRSSDIKTKAAHINRFIDAISGKELRGTNGRLIIQTVNTSFDANFAAIKSLQTRMNEISMMDVTSPEYQWAMQQITGQEQGEASVMLGVIKDCYYRTYSPFFWRPNMILHGFLLSIFLVVFLVKISN